MTWTGALIAPSTAIHCASSWIIPLRRRSAGSKVKRKPASVFCVPKRAMCWADSEERPGLFSRSLSAASSTLE